PPYPTEEIHLGTALNKILRDLVFKTKSMPGHYPPNVPGWDCNGLPIETQVEKSWAEKGKFRLRSSASCAVNSRSVTSNSTKKISSASAFSAAGTIPI